MSQRHGDDEQPHDQHHPPGQGLGEGHLLPPSAPPDALWSSQRSSAPPNRAPPCRVDHTYQDYSSFPLSELPVGSRKPPTTFPCKLHQILSTPAYSHIISWMPHGRAWKVHNRDLLVRDLISKYFTQNKYESFTRQLNGWGFKRLHQAGNDCNSYYHKCFLRGLPHLTVLMKRVAPNRGKQLPNVEGEPNFYEMEKQHPLPPGPTGQMIQYSEQHQYPASHMENRVGYGYGYRAPPEEAQFLLPHSSTMPYYRHYQYPYGAPSEWPMLEPRPEQPMLGPQPPSAPTAGWHSHPPPYPSSAPPPPPYHGHYGDPHAMAPYASQSSYQPFPSYPAQYSQPPPRHDTRYHPPSPPYSNLSRHSNPLPNYDNPPPDWAGPENDKGAPSDPPLSGAVQGFLPINKNDPKEDPFEPMSITAAGLAAEHNESNLGKGEEETYQAGMR